MPAYRYKSVDELKKDLAQFHDIEFDYRGQSYAICPIDGKFVAGNARGAAEFSSVDELLDKFLIDGRPLSEVVTEIEVYMH